MRSRKQKAKMETTEVISGLPVAATTSPKPDALREILTEVKAALRHGLRVIINNKVPDADPVRLKMEDAFENVKNALERGGRPTRELLASGMEHLGVAVALAANHSNTRGEDLAALRAAHASVTKQTEVKLPAEN